MLWTDWTRWQAREIAHAKSYGRRRLALNLVHAPESPRRWSAAVLARDARAQHLQTLRARHGRAAWRHGQRKGTFPRGLQEVRAGDGGRPTGRDPPSFLQ